jgi:hypothetical protein
MAVLDLDIAGAPWGLIACHLAPPFRRVPGESLQELQWMPEFVRQRELSVSR